MFGLWSERTFVFEESDEESDKGHSHADLNANEVNVAVTLVL